MFNYLKECEKDVIGFKEKIKIGGFLRTACLSHLKRQTGKQGRAAEKIAEKVLNDYLIKEKQQHEPLSNTKSRS